MSNYAVISDSACDLPTSIVKQYDIDIVPFKISFDKTNRLIEGIDISNAEFYRRLEASKAMPKTYYPSVGDYVARFKKPLEQGRDIVCLCLSSKLSKSYNSALNAKKILSHSYPNHKIVVIDTLLASLSQGILVLDAVKLSNKMNTEEAAARLEAVKKDSRVVVTVGSLEQLVRGGRMSNMTAALGKVLKINPIIYLEDGSLQSRGKAKGRKKALDTVKSLAIKEMGGRPDNYDFAMLHSQALAEATAVARDLHSQCGVVETLPPAELGATIGMHTGTSVVATVIMRKI